MITTLSMTARGASNNRTGAPLVARPAPVLRALLFDMDGTLAETEALAHRVSYNRAFAELGFRIEWTPELYRELLRAPGGGRDRLLHYRERYRPDLGGHADSDPVEWAKAIHAGKSRHFRKLLREGKLPLRSGVRRLFLEAVCAGVNIAIVTNATHQSVAPVVRYTLGARLAHCIEFVIGSEQVTRKKPNPESYLLALQKLRLEARDCLAIEDSESGLKAAVAAGLATLVVQSIDTVGQDFSAAGLVVDSFGDPGESQPRVLRGHLHEPCINLQTLRRLVGECAARAESGDADRASGVLT